MGYYLQKQLPNLYKCSDFLLRVLKNEVTQKLNYVNVLNYRMVIYILNH